MKRQLFSSKWLFLILAIIIGGFLRFYKLDWGEGYFFHPDEYHIASAVERISFPFQMNPKFFSYGSFTVYLIYFAKLLLSEISPQLSSLNPIFIGRFFSALFSTFTIIVVFFIAKELFRNYRLSLLSASLVALTPGLMQQAHFTTPESILTFWLFLTLFLWLVWLRKKKSIYLLLSAISLGLGVGTKVVAFTFLPIFFFQHLSSFSFRSKKLFLKKIAVLVVALILLSLTYFLVFPYSILDKEAFLYSMRYETGLGRGEPLVFYTRQFIDTVPLTFQFQKILFYALGPALLIFGTLGLVVLLLDLGMQILLHKLKLDWRLLTLVLAFGSYFLANALLFAKWTRFIAPSFPFWSIFVTYLIYRLSGSLKKQDILHNNVIGFISLVVILASMAWSLMFAAIYFDSDVRVEATSWINSQLPPNSFILTEAGNMLEAPLFGEHEKKSFDFYHLEEKQELKDQLPNLLFKSDYFIVQSRRIFYNHQRLHKYYPFTARFYDLLFSGRLGFEKINTFTSFPQLRIFSLKLEIPDEEAEETWSVFDHPVVRIYKKVRPLTEQDYERLL